MDAGCYTVHMQRLLGGGEPEVVSARAKLRTPDVDRAMDAELRFPSWPLGEDVQDRDPASLRCPSASNSKSTIHCL